MINKTIKEINNNLSYDLLVPSVNRKVKFKPLTIGNYKKLITSSINNEYNLVLNSIFKELSFENIEFTELDKQICMLGIRYYNISNFYKDINLHEKINTFIAHPEPILIEESNYTLHCKVPTIDQDNEYIKFCLTNTPNQDELLAAEIVKYVLETNTELAYEDKVANILNLPIKTLSKVVAYIDNIKNIKKQYYTLFDSVILPDNIVLLIE